MKVEIDIPSTLNDITLDQYQAFLRIHDNNDSNEFIAQKMVSIFCKIPLSQVLLINYNSVSEIVDHLNGLFEAKKNFIDKFKLGGVEFGFIPSLEDMSFGEYVDLEDSISDYQKMHQAMAVMFRPITERSKHGYEIEPYRTDINYSEVMKKAPLDVVFGAVVFFYDLGNELLKATLSYITEEAEKMTTQKKASLEKNGVGIKASIHSLKETLDTLNKLPHYQ